jgi:hypothetical protein
MLEGIGALDSADFEVAFVDEGFETRRAGLPECWTDRFERGAPVREVRSYPTQRSIRRDYWVATTRSRIACESHLERHHAMLMDFDPNVVALAAQPFRLYWPGTRGRRGHVPDFFARRSDGTGVVVDVRPGDLIGEEDAVAFAATARACALAGWEFERVGWIDPVLFANVKWLAGFRHPPLLRRRHGGATARGVRGAARSVRGRGCGRGPDRGAAGALPPTVAAGVNGGGG